MHRDDLGYLLRRSHDERAMADKADDMTARTAHDRMAGEYAARALKLLDTETTPIAAAPLAA